METLLMNVSSVWSNWIWPILLFIIGLGLVVFVHELGHFMVANWVGIKVERFAIGFGQRLIGFKRGQTDYCINVIPFGGYVKMLGQEDVKEVDKTADPGAFNNKPVGARFAVISAGVVMNVIFAAVLFVLVAMVGKNYLAPVVGSVLPGFPASQARIDWQVPCTASAPAEAAEAPGGQSGPADIGLKPGDRVLDIEGSNSILNFIGRPVTRFSDVFLVTALAEPNGEFVFTIRRDINGRPCIGKAHMGVKRLPDGSQLAFGLGSASDVVFAGEENTVSDNPFRDGDVLVAINGKRIEHQWQIDDVEKTLTGKVVKVNVERGGKPLEMTLVPSLSLAGDVNWLKAGTLVRGWNMGKSDGKFQFLLAGGQVEEVPEDQIAGGANFEALDILGMIQRLKVLAVDRSSPADKAGLRPGDIVVGYGDQIAPTLTAFHAINRKFQGKGTHISVRRGNETLKVWVVPSDRNEGARIGITQTADLMHPVVAGVREGSPAEKANIEPEALIKSVNGEPVETWIDVYNILCAGMGQPVTIVYQIGDRQKTAAFGKVDRSAFQPGMYEFSVFGLDVAFRPLEVKLVERNPLKALAWGAQETGKLVISTYLSLRRVGQGTVSTKALVGPVGIGDIAIKVGRKGLIDFVYFIAFISASLAAINFLPIPVVDGGHAVFLLIEKVRGRPLPSRVIYVAQVIGLGLIVLVFALLTYQDIGRILRNLW